MRERRPDDWRRDLANRHSVERAVASEIARHPHLRLARNLTNDFDRLDYQVVGPANRGVDLELKAKRQQLSSGWQCLRPDVPERDLFVLDELAMRKLVDSGRNAFMLVRDMPQHRWLLWSSGDLVAASRIRTQRTLERSSTRCQKGKLLLNLSEAGFSSATLLGALDEMCRLIPLLDELWSAVATWPRSAAQGALL